MLCSCLGRWVRGGDRGEARGVGEDSWDEQAVTESNHHEARRCQPKSPWPGEIPGGLAFMKPALLLKDGALKVHAGVGMDLVVGRFRVIPASDHTEPSPLQMPSHLGCTQTCQDCRAD